MGQVASDPGARATLPALVTEQVALAQRQLDWHLARARAAATQGPPGQRTAVGPVLSGLLRVMSKVHAERALDWRAPASDDAIWFAGESQDLQEMLGNLLDNAGRWVRQTVAVGVQQRNERLQITIDDDGPGIAPERRAAALTRGVRLDESAPGSGLGLHIVAELSGLYGGSVELGDSPLGGLRVQLKLPVPPDPT
ncbi:MAG: signal transduction histidine kinase [Hydrogenophaga sp.]|jgi:signal transduction histidine kinase